LELENGAELLGGTEWELLFTEELRFQSTQWSCRYVHSFFKDGLAHRSAALAFSPVDPNLLVSGCRSASSGQVVVIWDVSSTSCNSEPSEADLQNLRQLSHRSNFQEISYISTSTPAERTLP
jgi:hypothetical protein